MQVLGKAYTCFPAPVASMPELTAALRSGEYYPSWNQYYEMSKRLCDNSEKRLLSVRHAGSPIKLRTGPIRHPVSKPTEKNGFPFGVVQGGESIEPWVKPGMTILTTLPLVPSPSREGKPGEEDCTLIRL